MYIYIYIERERYREREMYVYMCVYIYIYIHTHIHNALFGVLDRCGAPGPKSCRAPAEMIADGHLQSLMEMEMGIQENLHLFKGSGNGNSREIKICLSPRTLEWKFKRACQNDCLLCLDVETKEAQPLSQALLRTSTGDGARGRRAAASCSFQC